LPKLEVDLTDRQWEAWQLLRDPTVRAVLYGGAKGGGKSYLLCTDAYARALEYIDRFQLKPAEHVPHIGWMGRKQGVDFTGTTLQTWQNLVPQDTYELKSANERHPKHILIQGSIAIDYGGLDRQDSINKFNSAEYAHVWVDQAEETQRAGEQDDISVLRGSLRLMIQGQELDYTEFYTANPRQCWLRDELITGPHAGGKYRFVPALPADNPHLPSSYVETLTDAFGHRPELLQAYLYGSWDAIGDPAQVLQDAWIEAALHRILHTEARRKLLSCDVARFGDDEVVIYGLHDTRIVEEQIFGKKDTHYTANVLHRMALDGGYRAVVVDDSGVGGGVTDQLAAMHDGRYAVIPVNGAAKPSDERYYNLRAEMWDTVAKMFSEGDVDVAPWDRGGSEPQVDALLRAQLCTPLYEFRSNGKLLIEPKDKIKARLGRSPDRADCYVQGLYCLRQVPIIPADHEPRHRRRGYRMPEMNPMTL
jgi:hypothetical protein